MLFAPAPTANLNQSYEHLINFDNEVRSCILLPSWQTIITDIIPCPSVTPAFYHSPSRHSDYRPDAGRSAFYGGVASRSRACCSSCAATSRYSRFTSLCTVRLYVFCSHLCNLFKSNLMLIDHVWTTDVTHSVRRSSYLIVEEHLQIKSQLRSIVKTSSRGTLVSAISLFIQLSLIYFHCISYRVVFNSA